MHVPKTYCIISVAHNFDFINIVPRESFHGQVKHALLAKKGVQTGATAEQGEYACPKKLKMQ